MFCLCSGNRFFHSPCFQGLLTVVFRSSYTLYTGLLLVLHPSLFIQSLSKNCLSFRLPFQRESVCKGKAFFRNLQFFSKVFFEIFFRRFQEGVRLTLSRSLAHPQGKILGAAVSTISRSLSSSSLSSSASLPLESGCKGTDFFLSRNFYSILFCRIFSGYCLTRWFTLYYKA